MNLTPEQHRAVSYRGGDLQIVACAGAGKTEAISRRVAALLREGADPRAIIAFTFTERAGAELKERIYRRTEELQGREFLDQLGRCSWARSTAGASTCCRMPCPATATMK